MKTHGIGLALGCVSLVVLVTTAETARAQTGITVGGDTTGLFTYDLEDYSAYAGVKGTAFSMIGHPTLGIDFGERFVGQTTVYSNGFDVLQGLPSVPLAIDGSIADNYAINILWIYSTTVIDGLGPDGFPNSTAIGDGAMSVLYARDQSVVGFDLIGSNGGAIQVRFYDRNGNVLDTVVFATTTNTTYIFSSATENIAALTITNTDWGGVAFDNFVFELGDPTEPPVCNAGAGYVVDWGGDETSLAVDAGVPAGQVDLFDISWATDCPGGYFDDSAGATPTLFVDTSGACVAQCSVTVEVTNGVETAVCSSDVSIGQIGPTTPTCPPAVTVETDGAGNTAEYDAWVDSLSAGQPNATVDVVVVPGTCGDTLVATGTVTVGTGTGPCGGTCSSTFEVVDTTPPDIVVEPSEIVVTDLLCEGFVAVDLPTAVASDIGGAVVVTNDAPALFPSGQTTTVTYTATDECGNTATATVDVTVLYGSSIAAEVTVRTVGNGRGRTQADMPMEGVIVSVYDRTSGSCASAIAGDEQGYSQQSLDEIVAQCDPVAEGVTDADGYALIDVPPGRYLLVAQFDLDGDGTVDYFIGTPIRPLGCSHHEAWRLRLQLDENGVPVSDKKGKP